MSAHSPGPWIFCDATPPLCQCGNIWSKPGDSPIARVLFENAEEDAKYGIEMVVANARLIAAAPELFAALETALASAEKAVELIHGEYCGGSLDDCDECRDELTEQSSMRALVARIKGTP